MLYGDEPVDVVVIRDGETVTLNNLPLEQQAYVVDGETEIKYGISFNMIEATGGEKLKYAAYSTMNFVRLIRVSLVEIFSGNVGWGEVSGPGRYRRHHE